MTKKQKELLTRCRILKGIGDEIAAKARLLKGKLSEKPGSVSMKEINRLQTEMKQVYDELFVLQKDTKKLIDTA